MLVISMVIIKIHLELPSFSKVLDEALLQQAANWFHQPL